MSDNVTSNERVSLVTPLARSHRLDRTVTSWCESQIDSQKDNGQLPSHGFDIVTGVERTFTHVLLDILMPYGPSSTT